MRGGAEIVANRVVAGPANGEYPLPGHLYFGANMNGFGHCLSRLQSACHLFACST